MPNSLTDRVNIVDGDTKFTVRERESTVQERCTIVELTSQIRRKSCCSTRNNSQVVLVTTVLSLGKSYRIDSPNVAPTPKLHNVTGGC